MIVDPPDTMPIAEGHAVIVVGHANGLPELRARYALQRERTYRGVRYPY